MRPKPATRSRCPRRRNSPEAEKAGAFALASLHHRCAGSVPHPCGPRTIPTVRDAPAPIHLAVSCHRLHPTPVLRRSLSAKVLRPGIDTRLSARPVRAAGLSTRYPAPDLSAHLAVRALRPFPRSAPLRALGTWRLHCGLPPLAGPSVQRPCFRSYAAPPCSSVVRGALRPVGPGGGQRFSGSSQRPEQQRRSPFLM